jgi:hypothetical protein
MAIAIYRASDGKEFDTAEAADRYESQMGKVKTITAWVEKHYNNARLTKKHTNVIMEWEAYRDEALSAAPPTIEAIAG